MKKHWLYLLAYCSMITSAGLYATRDNPHFYRATNFFGETRFEKPRLSTFDFYVSGGSTSRAFNKKGNSVPLFDLYGPNNMQLLGVGVPCKDLSNNADIILEELALIPARDCFAHLSFEGDFHLTEFNGFWIQNLKRGFFLQLHVPVRKVEINDISYCDLSPTDCESPNACEQIWQSFLNDFENILNTYCLCCDRVDKHGLGDISFQIGWALNYQETDVLDFVDFTIKTGVLFSTSKKLDYRNIYDIVPLGYNGHSGIPFSLDAAIGTYDWLTIGGRLGALFFFDDCQDLRMKTDINQSGIIKLAKGRAKVHKGTIWEAGAFLKADHFFRGLSCLFGYSFVAEQDSEICPQDCDTFSTTIVNSDEMFKRWQMHTIHLRAEYDFTKEYSRVGTRVSFFYDYPFQGERIFRTSMIGGHFGIDIAWDF